MSLQILLSVRKVLICPKSHNVFTHFLEDDSLNNLKHNDYVFATIQNNCCKMAYHLNSEFIQRLQLHFLNLYFINVKKLKLHISAAKKKKLIANSAFLTAPLCFPKSLAVEIILTFGGAIPTLEFY